MLLFLLGQDAVFVSDKVLSTSIKALKNELAGMQARERESVCVRHVCMRGRVCERECVCALESQLPQTRFAPGMEGISRWLSAALIVATIG